MPETNDADRPACHRFFVPLALPKPNPLNHKETIVQPQVANSECLGAACMMWNPDRSECFDKTQARAISRIADNYVVPHGSQ